MDFAFFDLNRAKKYLNTDQRTKRGGQALDPVRWLLEYGVFFLMKQDGARLGPTVPADNNLIRRNASPLFLDPFYDSILFLANFD